MLRSVNAPARIEQEQIVAFLSSGEAFGGRAPERIDTHISHIFLTGDRAYKMKRALKLDFLDYSSRAKRRRLCEKEVEVNRIFAPDLYLGVVPVTQEEKGLALGGCGKPVEWLVEMVRFAAGARFDELAERGELTGTLIDGLADRVAQAHRDCPVTPSYGRTRHLASFRDNIGNTLLGLGTEKRDRETARSWLGDFDTELAAQSGAIEARRRRGFVRRCHGDMHLANICLFEGRPTPFDAIEFNDEIASSDLLYDIAFPLMDFLRIDRRDFANRLLNRYLGWTGDYRHLDLMPLFLSLRAGVRAMTTALKGGGTDVIARVEGLERLAVELLASRPTPRLIAIGGLSGSGKSSVASALAPDIAAGIGAIVLRSDVVRKRLFGVAPEEPLPARAYREETHTQVYARMLKDGRRALGAGQAVILDATFLDPGQRRAARDLADELGVRFDGIWLDAPLSVLRARIEGRAGDASDATVAVLERQAARCAPVEWRKADVSRSPAGSLANVRALLAAA